MQQGYLKKPPDAALAAKSAAKANRSAAKASKRTASGKGGASSAAGATGQAGFRSYTSPGGFQVTETTPLLFLAPHAMSPYLKPPAAAPVRRC